MAPPTRPWLRYLLRVPAILTVLGVAAGIRPGPARAGPTRDIRSVGSCMEAAPGAGWTVPLDEPADRNALDAGAVLVCDTPDVGWRAIAAWPDPPDALLRVAADVARWVEFLPYVVASDGGGAPDRSSTGTFTLQVRGRSASHRLQQAPSGHGLVFTVTGDPGSPLRRARGTWTADPAKPGLVFCSLDAQARWWTPAFLLRDLGRDGLGRLVWEVRREAAFRGARPVESFSPDVR